MKIAFDHQIFTFQGYGGVSRYFTFLARELAELGEEPGVFAPRYRTNQLQDLPPGIVRGSHFLGSRRRASATLDAWRARIGLTLWRPNVVHETYFSGWRSAPPHVPAVITVYDMIHELLPEQFAPGDPLVELKRKAVARADHVICISQSTSNDVTRLYGLPPDRISVVHLGVEPPTIDPTCPRHATASSERPFLLYVGSRVGYKNFESLLGAMALSPGLVRDFDLVAFGGGDLSQAELALVNRFGLAGKVRHYGGDDATLHDLYRRARALVYPSLFEGFGLPLLEAMAHGCAVIASNTSSIPEVVGDAGDLFDPRDASAMMRAIESVVYSEERSRMLIQRGYERSKLFSWRRCAEKTIDVYRKVAKH